MEETAASGIQTGPLLEMSKPIYLKVALSA